MFRKSVAIAAMVIGAMGVASGTSYADPGVPEANNINYETRIVDKTIVTNIDSGRFEVVADGQALSLTDSAGNAVMQMPLSFAVDHVLHPYLTEVKNDGQTLELTPDMDPAKAVDLGSLATPVASLIENQRAQDAFATQFGLATAIGGFTGTIVGAIVGAIVGMGAAGLSCLAAMACIIAGLPIIAAFSGVGAIIGTAVVGGPAVVIAGVDLIQTLVAPPGTTKWNYPDRVITAPAPAQ